MGRLKNTDFVVISLGGSVISHRPEIVFELKNELDTLNKKFVLIVGGGSVGRSHIHFARKFRLSEKELHEVGIKSTLLNAFIISCAMKAKLYEGDPRLLKTSESVVMGGFKEGWTTDVCAAYSAVALGSPVLFNLSKEKGVYDKDPSKYPDAKKIDFIGFKRLYRLTRGSRVPGMNFIFDPEAARICENKGIKVVITSNVRDISAFLSGKEISGTLVK